MDGVDGTVEVIVDGKVVWRRSDGWVRAWVDVEAVMV